MTVRKGANKGKRRLSKRQTAFASNVIGRLYLSNWQTREVDFIIENEKGDLLGVEVKAGTNVGNEDFKHLKWFGENLAKMPYTGIVLYTGEHVQRFGEGFYAVPVSVLSA